MTRAEVQAWQARWKLVNEQEIKELRATTPEQKLGQLASLMASVDAFGWRQLLEEDDSLARDRWNKLRQEYARQEAFRA